MATAQVHETHRTGGGRLHAARAVLERGIEQQAFPGAAWGVLHRGEVVALDAVGRFTYEETAPAVEPETVFDLASVTKVMATTSAAMVLVDQGRLDLDMRLGDILPGFVVGMEPHSGKERVTLRMLLEHTSGLPAYVELFRTCATPDALLRAALALPLEAKPGERAEYSDIGFILLGKALEVLSGEKLDRLWMREVREPLGLETARFCPPRWLREGIAPTENDTWFRGRLIQGEVQDENAYVLGGVAGHAGLFANTRDLLRLAACLLAGGKTADGRQVFRPETVELFTKRQESGRALGWDVPKQAGSAAGKYFGSRSVGHLGYAGTSLWIDPEQELAVALLTNRTWPDRSSQAIKAVRPAFHDAVVEEL
ncbi:MAG: serine hydrolase domain-containing protein [Acidobacteriaceae bacterium]